MAEKNNTKPLHHHAVQTKNDDEDNGIIVVSVSSDNSTGSLDYDFEEEPELIQENFYIHKNVSCQKHFLPYIATILSCPLYVIGCFVGVMPSLDDVSDEEREKKMGYYRMLYVICGLCTFISIILLVLNLILLVKGKWIYLTARRLYFDLHVGLIVFMITLPSVFLILS